MTREVLGDDWYESEQPIRTGLVCELQRVRRRTIARPLPVLVLAALVTGAVVFKIITKQRQYHAEVVLAMTEGAVLDRLRAGIPFDQLGGYVSSVLLPDAKLAELIQKRNLHPLRRTLGMPWALGELRMQMSVDVWKNSFIYYHESESRAPKSARVGITVVDDDPDRAFAIAQDLGRIAVAMHQQQQDVIASRVAQEVKQLTAAMSEELGRVQMAMSLKQTAYVDAQKRGRDQLAAALSSDLIGLADQEKTLRDKLEQLAQSRDAVADELVRAGIDTTTLRVVAERRPIRSETSAFLIIVVIAVISTCVFVCSAIFVGAFDTRVHDTDDVARLGLPVLGSVPAFTGDHVGSMEARGARRAGKHARVPSWLRWRLYR